MLSTLPVDKLNTSSHQLDSPSLESLDIPDGQVLTIHQTIGSHPDHSPIPPTAPDRARSDREIEHAVLPVVA